MTSKLRCPSAYVDFRCADSLATVASLLSKRLFGGIEFVGENTGIWDEVPAVRLSRPFLGLHVELGGGDGSFTLQIESPEFPWELVEKDAHTDLSEYVAFLLKRIEGIDVTE